MQWICHPKNPVSLTPDRLSRETLWRKSDDKLAVVGRVSSLADAHAPRPRRPDCGISLISCGLQSGVSMVSQRLATRLKL
jgi:hypothetical protein